MACWNDGFFPLLLQSNILQRLRLIFVVTSMLCMPMTSQNHTMINVRPMGSHSCRYLDTGVFLFFSMHAEVPVARWVLEIESWFVKFVFSAVGRSCWSRTRKCRPCDFGSAFQLLFSPCPAAMAETVAKWIPLKSLFGTRPWQPNQLNRGRLLPHARNNSTTMSSLSDSTCCVCNPTM